MPHTALTYAAALPYIMSMQSVVETSIFTRQADSLLSWDERAKLIGLLASEPEAGDLVPGLGGIRKLRFAAGGRGKRARASERYGVLS